MSTKHMTNPMNYFSEKKQAINHFWNICKPIGVRLTSSYPFMQVQHIWEICTVSMPHFSGSTTSAIYSNKQVFEPNLLSNWKSGRCNFLQIFQCSGRPLNIFEKTLHEEESQKCSMLWLKTNIIQSLGIKGGVCLVFVTFCRRNS